MRAPLHQFAERLVRNGEVREFIQGLVEMGASPASIFEAAMPKDTALASLSVQRFVRRLERVLLSAPKGIWLFGAGNTLHVMRYGEDGKRLLNETGTGMNPLAVIHKCKTNIEVDGGDW